MSISLELYELGVPNLVCSGILGWWSVMYYLRVTVTFNLTSELVFRITMSGAHLILFDVGIPNLVCECILGWRSVPSHFRVTVTLTSDLVSRIGIESGAYLLYSLK